MSDALKAGGYTPLLQQDHQADQLVLGRVLGRGLHTNAQASDETLKQKLFEVGVELEYCLTLLQTLQSVSKTRQRRLHAVHPEHPYAASKALEEFLELQRIQLQAKRSRLLLLGK